MSQYSLHAQDRDKDTGLILAPNTVKPNKKYGFRIFKDDAPDETAELAKTVFKLTPRLRPARLERRMKMLLGLDINDYPQDCMINLGGERNVGFYLLNPKTGIIRLKTYQDDPVMGIDIPKSFPPEKYASYYRYTMMNDLDALHESYQKYNYEEPEDNMYSNDFIADEYNYAIFDAKKSIIEYRDRQLKRRLLPLRNYYYYLTYYSNRRLDAVSLYTKQEMKKGRKLYISRSNRLSDIKPTDKDIFVQTDPFYTSFIDVANQYTPLTSFLSFGGEEYNPWYPTLTAESVTASWLAFQLSLNVNSINNKIVRDMYKKYNDFYYQEMMDRLKKALEDNNYYGHTILREFLTNPMREMPTLEKIGNGFRAKVKNENILLLLEPVATSYDIDTIKTTETFTAYEMGHDDYYFIEIEKPVESPIAGKDGYAMILDRTETVYGYVLKSQVREYTSQNVLQENRYTNKSKSKQGVIEDPDGYVNIRKEPNTQSEIAGKIVDKEIFRYWITKDNWYVVETRESIRGYVYKDRIREKYETGGWILDE